MPRPVHQLLAEAVRRDVRNNALVFFVLHISLCITLIVAAWNTPGDALALDSEKAFTEAPSFVESTGTLILTAFTEDAPKTPPILTVITKVTSVNQTIVATTAGIFKTGRGVWHARDMPNTVTEALEDAKKRADAAFVFTRISVLKEAEGKAKKGPCIVRPLVPW